MFGYWCGSRVYLNLTKKPHKTKTYREHLTQMTTETFRQWPKELLDKVFDKSWNECKVWIVPASFCSMRYIPVVRYLEEETTLEDNSFEKPKENNAQLLQVTFLLSSKDFISFVMLSVQLLRNSTLDKELVVYYDNKHQFHGWSTT